MQLENNKNRHRTAMYHDLSYVLLGCPVPLRRHLSRLAPMWSRAALCLSRVRLSSGGGLESSASTSNKSCGPPASSFIRTRSSGWTTKTSRPKTLSLTILASASRCHRLCAHRISADRPRAVPGITNRRSSGIGSSGDPARHSTLQSRFSQNLCRRPWRVGFLKGLGLLSAKRSISWVARTTPQADTARPPIKAKRIGVCRATEAFLRRFCNLPNADANRCSISVSAEQLHVRQDRIPRVQGPSVGDRQESRETEGPAEPVMGAGGPSDCAEDILVFASITVRLTFVWQVTIQTDPLPIGGVA